MDGLDAADRQILLLLQRGIPYTARPYEAIAREIGGITEGEVLERISELKERNIIRRLSGFFSSEKLGYVTALCAVKVSEKDIDQVAELINRCPGVTHNYVREHEYNMWFTLIARDVQSRERVLNEIESCSLVDHVLRLYTGHRYKINVIFDLEDRGGGGPVSEVEEGDER